MPAGSYGALGQVKPAAATLTDCYVCPVARRATVRLIVTNEFAYADTFSASLAPAGAGDAPAQYIATDLPIRASDSVSSVPITCGPGDVIRVRSAGGFCSFTVTGIEKDVL